MSDAKITVGGAIEEDAAPRFVDAWHRTKRGEAFREQHLVFESWDALFRILTGKRMAAAAHNRRARRSGTMRGLITEVTEMHHGNYCVACWLPDSARMARPLPNGMNWTAPLLRTYGIAPGSLIEFQPSGARPDRHLSTPD